MADKRKQVLLLLTVSPSILVTKSAGLLFYVASILSQFFIVELGNAVLPKLRGRVTLHRKILLFLVL